MEIDINGDPGTGNHFDDVHIQQVGNYSPNAKQDSIPSIRIKQRVVWPVGFEG